MKPKFLFTLGGDLGQQTISEPEGWATIIFNLERDLTYWSLVENFELPLIFYGMAESKDGGYSYLSSAIANGIDTLVTLEIQISFNEGNSYEVCFEGRIDLSTAKEIVYRRKIQAAIVRNDLWSVFMAKKSTPVNLLSSTDIYGHTRYGIPLQEINLPSQKIIKNYSGDMSEGGTLLSIFDSYFPNGVYGQIDFDEIILSEINDKFILPTGANPTIPSPLFELQEDGDFYFDVRFEISYLETTLNSGTGALTYQWFGAAHALAVHGADLNFYIKVNSQPAVLFSKSADLGSTSKSTVFQFAQLLHLIKGDQIAIYSLFIGNGDDPCASRWVFYGKSASNSIDQPTPHLSGGVWSFQCDNRSFVNITFPSPPSGITNPTYMNVNGNTSLAATSADTLLLHDTGLSICDRILGKDDSFYSSFLGGAHTAFSYPANGCGYLNAVTRGLNIRGYTFTEKPFTLSFDDYWTGINPVFNLSLSYEELSVNSPGSTVIRVENKSYVFNNTPSIYLTAINDINIEFDLNLFTKTIEIGFEQWAAESASGIDDPQTKHIYALRYKLFGKEEKQLSKFIAASLAIEQGRRLTKLQNQDWRLDENTFLIALQEQDLDVVPQTSPSTITEQPEVFSASPSPITGLTNPETRYNVRHTPARMLERWKDFYSGQMQSYLTDFFKYQSGEGNVLMSWTGDTCDLGTLTENQNQSISSTYLFLPIIYSFTHPLTWDEYSTIRDNRKNAISISWILSGTTYTKIAFIKKLGYDINKSKANFEVWIKS